MANWIKVEKVTPDKPEILLLANKLRVSQAEAFLQFFRLFAWADDHVGEGGVVPFLSRREGDTLAHLCPGTCDALASPEIGWLLPRADGAPGFLFRNWERHNGKSAKARASDTEKKRRQRAESGKRVPIKTGPEKRREEKNTEEKSRGRFSFSQADLATASWMFALIREIDPTACQPNLQAWANDVRLMRDRDDRSDAMIRDVFLWAHQDPFWRANILSPAKLRKQFLQLLGQKARPAGGRDVQRTSSSRVRDPGFDFASLEARTHRVVPAAASDANHQDSQDDPTSGA